MDLNAKTSNSAIDARYLPCIVSGAKRAGYDIDRILVRAGIDPALQARPQARITQRQFATLLSYLTRITGDEFWLIGGRKIKPGTFKAMCKQAIRCATLGDAIRTASHFYHLVADDFAIRLHEDGRQACITVTDALEDVGQRPVMHGTIITFSYGLICWLIGKRLPLDGVHNAFPGESFLSELAHLYRAPVLYDQRRSELRFPAVALDWPILRDEKQLSRFLASVPSVLLVRYHDENSFTDRVRMILRRNLHRPLSFDHVASMLAISQQTLRRRLQEEGNNGFQQLKDHIRRDAAFALLETTTLTIEEIAVSLGFSELSTFHRAFRRWAQWTPGLYRQTLAASLNDAPELQKVTRQSARPLAS